MLPVPKYIRDAGITDDKIRYTWDDWNIEDAEKPIDEDFHVRLQAVSLRANMAFTIAVGEWIVGRLESLFDDPLPNECLEGAWAQVVHFRYAVPWDPFDQEWTGPALGPIKRAMMWVRSVVQYAEEKGNTARCCSRISKLAEHIMPDPAPYKNWRDRVMDRLEKLYPLDPEDRIGDVIPHEAMDPDFDFDPASTEALIKTFLGALDYDDNSFLCTPDEMSSYGFEGKPYEFKIEDDRSNRTES